MYAESVMRAHRKETWMGSGETEFRLLFQGRKHLRGPWGMNRSLPGRQMKEVYKEALLPLRVWSWKEMMMCLENHENPFGQNWVSEARETELREMSGELRWEGLWRPWDCVDRMEARHLGPYLDLVVTCWGPRQIPLHIPASLFSDIISQACLQI